MYSRRFFLKLFGVAAVGVSLPLSLGAPKFKLSATSQGRALEPLTVFKKPDADAPIVNTLWPDSIVPILGSSPSWYRVPDGFVARIGLQPMLAYDPDEHPFVSNESFWAEVAAPSVVVYEHCAADAPFVTRIGHGGVAKVVDALPGEPNGWYGIADDPGTFLGWTQANRWRAINSEAQVVSSEAGFRDRILQIDARTSQLTAVEQGKTVLQADCSMGRAMMPGRYAFQSQQPGGSRWEGAETFHGVPWQTRFSENLMLAGAYWHNRFGELVNGPTVQVPPLVARWLYGWLGEGSAMVVL